MADVIVLSDDEEHAKERSPETKRIKLEGDENVIIIDEEPSKARPTAIDPLALNVSTPPSSPPQPTTNNDTTADTITTPEEEQLINLNASSPAVAETMPLDPLQVDEDANCDLLLTNFIDECAKSISGSTYETRLTSKFDALRKRFAKLRCAQQQRRDDGVASSLERLLTENVAKAKESSARAVIAFNQVYTYVLDQLREQRLVDGGGTVAAAVVPSQPIDSTINKPEHDKKVRLLQKTIKLLLRKIKYLQEQEVDFDDDHGSSYIKHDRYTQRLNQVYDKYCQLMGQNAYEGRWIYRKFTFTASKYPEINRAITKKFNPSTSNNNIINISYQFPCYRDVEKCVKRCVTKHQQNNNNSTVKKLLLMSDAELKVESEHCFKQLGKLLKRRRQRELYESHSDYLRVIGGDGVDDGDPAVKDEDLRGKLEANERQGTSRMNEIIETYVKQQENYQEKELSDDSDDSDYQDSDCNNKGDDDS